MSTVNTTNVKNAASDVNSIILKTNGNVDFTKNVLVGNNPQAGAQAGSFISYEGTFIATNDNPSAQLFRGYTTGNATPTFLVTADGIADFGSINIGSLTTSGCEVRSDGLIRIQRPASSSSDAIQIWRGTLPITTLNSNGSITSGGDPSTGVTGVKAFAEGGIYVASATDSGYGLWRGYTTGNTNPTSSINADGSIISASFIDADQFNVSRSTVDGKDNYASKLSVADTGKHFLAKDVGGNQTAAINADGSITTIGIITAPRFTGGSGTDDYAFVGITNNSSYGTVYAENSAANGLVFEGQDGTSRNLSLYGDGRIQGGNFNAGSDTGKGYLLYSQTTTDTASIQVQSPSTVDGQAPAIVVRAGTTNPYTVAYDGSVTSSAVTLTLPSGNLDVGDRLKKADDALKALKVSAAAASDFAALKAAVVAALANI